MDLENQQPGSMIRYIIGASRVKFDVLDQLYSQVNHSGYKMGVMFVDAHSIFYRLFRGKELAATYADSKDELVRDIVVGFFNVLGHYRRYIATRLEMDNDIYVVFNRTLPHYHKKFANSWCEKLYARYDKDDPQTGFIASALEKAYSFITGLSPYFEGIYCLDNNGIDDGALIARMGFSDDIFYTIFSRSMYMTQFIRPNVVQLFNKRDDSYLLTEKNCYRKGVLSERKTVAHEKLTPDMLPLFWTLAGCKDVGIPSTKHCAGITAMIKTANKMAESGELIPQMSIQSFLDAYEKYAASRIAMKVDRGFFENRYKVLSASVAAAGITSDQVAKIRSMCYDVYNETELEQLNELLAVGEFDPELLEIQNLNLSEAVRYDY